MYSIYFIKRLSKAKPPFVILRFDIRYSAVTFLIQTIKADSGWAAPLCTLPLPSTRSKMVTQKKRFPRSIAGLSAFYS
jgi:hypothetical protein